MLSSAIVLMLFALCRILYALESGQPIYFFTGATEQHQIIELQTRVYDLQQTMFTDSEYLGADIA